MPIGTFGPVVFQVSSSLVRTFDEMRRTGQTRYAEHQVIGKKPRLEMQGLGLEQVTFQMTLSRDLGLAPDTELEILRAVRDEGTPYFLVLGETIVGRFVLEGLSQEEGQRSATGGATWIKAELSLKEYANEG